MSGDHYLTIHYQKGFLNDDNKVDRFDIKQNKFIENTNPLNNGLIKKYHTTEMEDYFNKFIEEPAIFVFNKLRTFEQINVEEKITLARYIIAQMRRSPYEKELLKEIYPKTFEELLKIYKGKLPIPNMKKAYEKALIL